MTVEQQLDNTALLGKEKVSTLLLQYAIPSIIAMTASALYNIASSIFIGHGVGPAAITALAIVLPLSNLSAAFGAMVGIGASSLLSIKLGQQDRESAQMILGNVLLLNIIIGFSFGLVCLIFLEPILYAFGASENTIGYATDYLKILLWANVITHMYFGLNHTMRASGYPKKSMFIMVTSVVINTVLSGIFIMWFEWGMKGAAWATVIAQTTSLVLQFNHFRSSKYSVYFTRESIKLKKKIIHGILSIGAAPFFMNIAATVVVILINTTLRRYGGDNYIGAYGIVNRVTLIFLMIVMGLNQGMQPIVGYNYGARQFSRVKEALQRVTVAAMVITSIGFVMAVFFPHLVSMAFTTDPDLLEASNRALRITMIVFPMVGFQVISSSFFQSIGKAKSAIFLSLTRQLIFLIPLLLILPPLMGTDGVWWSMPISDFVSGILAVVLISRQLKQFSSETVK